MEAFTGPFSIKTVMQGSATWETSRGRYEVTPGRYLILNHGTRYALSMTGDPPVETFCLFFQHGFVEQACRAVTTSADRLLDAPDQAASSFELLETMHEASDSELYGLVSALHTVVRSEGVSGLGLSGALHQAATAIVGRSAAIAELSRRLPAARESTRREIVRRLQRARDYIDAQIDRPLRLSDLAREACLSAFHFHRSFRAFYGETPRAYATRRRLDRAAARLKATDIPVIDVGMDAGFENAAHFSRAFKRRFGCPPQAYRRIWGSGRENHS
jgi:AraC-like DNA-binding protein